MNFMISPLNLTDLYYTQLDSVTWCATAQVGETLCLSFKALKTQISWLLIAPPPFIHFYNFTELQWQYYASPHVMSARQMAHNQRQLQRQGVRQLLQKLLTRLNIDDTLDESNFPYRLRESKYYVCFSHTGTDAKNDINKKSNQLINRQLGSHVAVIISNRRPVGIDIENSNIAWRVVQRYYSVNEIALLESLSIIQRDYIAKLLWQIKESFIKIQQYTLAQGLGKDYAHFVTDLIDSINEPSFMKIISDRQSQYYIVVLPIQQTVIVF